jgi:deoxyribodipyrimidine photolyase
MPLPPADARPVLLWYRQDLRIDDHAAPNDAVAGHRLSRSGLETFQNKLISRDFSSDALWHHATFAPALRVVTGRDS